MVPFTRGSATSLILVKVSSFLDLAYSSTWNGHERWRFVSSATDPWTAEVQWGLKFSSVCNVGTGLNSFHQRHTLIMCVQIFICKVFMTQKIFFVQKLHFFGWEITGFFSPFTELILLQIIQKCSPRRLLQTWLFYYFQDHSNTLFSTSAQCYTCHFQDINILIRFF